MKSVKIHREKTGLFSDLANELVYQQDHLKEFIQQEFSLEAFETQMEKKQANYPAANRATVADVLKTNYSAGDATEAQQKNLALLAKENTFTITTGHQLSLLTGPLYFVIKILHAVRLAEELAIKYPNQNFVPIFWMASEDHDFAEINQVNLFNQKFSWTTEQTGAVGRFTLENWSEFIDGIKALFANRPEAEIQTVLESYTGANLAEATFYLVNTLFGTEGVLVLDADQAKLKTLLAPVFEQELTKNSSFYAVEATNQELKKAGWNAQAFAREINVFLLEKGTRERIQYDNGVYFTDSGTRFSREVILEQLRHHPADFSPNVILRPLYQELILPNLCYLGGGGEMAYWLQLKGVFEAYGVVYPLIQVRNSLMLIDEATQKKMENVGWETKDLFSDVDAQKKAYVLANASELDLTEMREKQQALIDSCRNLVNVVDSSLTGYLEAEMTRMSKQLDNLEQKLIRAEKSNYEKVLNQMDQIKEKLFPNGGLQERSSNFFSFCADGDVQTHLAKIKAGIDPFEKDFVVLYL
ncbi:MAG: bacillithiol biosynthesis cysteine-adding enzyme BshC [Crocinitomicaceae bacterium]